MIFIVAAFLLSGSNPPSVPFGIEWDMTREEVLALPGFVVEESEHDGDIILTLPNDEDFFYAVSANEVGVESVKQLWSCGADVDVCRQLYGQSLVRVGIEFGAPTPNYFVKKTMELSLAADDFVVSEEMPVRYFHHRAIDVLVFGGYSDQWEEFRMLEMYIPGDPTEAEMIGMAAEWWRDVASPKLQESEKTEN